MNSKQVAIALISFLAAMSLFAEKLPFRGQVLSADGKALAGANVLFPKEESGAATDYDGYFCLKLATSRKSLAIHLSVSVGA